MHQRHLCPRARNDQRVPFTHRHDVQRWPRVGHRRLQYPFGGVGYWQPVGVGQLVATTSSIQSTHYSDAHPPGHR